MFRKELKKKIEGIFGFKKVTFNAPSVNSTSGTFEQDTIFIEIHDAHARVTEGHAYAKVSGYLAIFAEVDKMPFGFFNKKIQQADHSLTKDIFFHNIDRSPYNSPIKFENTPSRIQNISERRIAFVYLFSEQYNPSRGSLTSLETSIVKPLITLSISPVRGAVGTLITVTSTDGTDLSTATGLTVGGTSTVFVSQSASTLVAMVMPGSTTGQVVLTTSGGSGTAASNFTVSATGVPTMQQAPKLVPSDNSGAANFGVATALSADGNTALIGGYLDNVNIGAAWVFTRSGGVWSQQGLKLLPSDAAANSLVGTSVALSADGNTAILGGSQDSASVGAAWVFTRSGGVWSQQGAKLVGTGAVGAANQGSSVALSADGNTALSGGSSDNGNKGATWVFTRSGGVWSQQGSKLVGTGAVGASLQGIAVALSADGNTAIIGAQSDNGNAGAAWIFTRSGGVWSQQGAKLVGTGAVDNALQGYFVALSADGNTALSGGEGDDSNNGATWVFTRSGGVWSQQGAKLVSTDYDNSGGSVLQGQALALSADGNTAVIGGANDASGVGATWVFTRSGGVWSQVGLKIVVRGETGLGYQGYLISISSDGSTALSGGISDNGGIGACWVFTPPVSPPVPQPTLMATLSPNAGADPNNRRINVFNRSSTGSVTPVRTIAGDQTQITAGSGPIAVDRVHGEIFICDFTTSSILVFNSTDHGNVAPKRIIRGDSTLLSFPQTMAVDPIHNEIMVVNTDGADPLALVFSRTANGDVAPERSFTCSAVLDSNSGLPGLTSTVYGLVIDTIHNEIILTSQSAKCVVVFSRTARGSVAPLRTIQGDNTQFSLGFPTGVGVDVFNNEIIVACQGQILSFSRTADGDIAPLRVIKGAATTIDPQGANAPYGTLIVDPVADEITIADEVGFNSTDTILTFSRTANGDIAPIRSLTGNAAGVWGVDLI